MDNSNSQPLTAQVLSQATMTTLVQTLSGDPETRITGLDAAPLERADSRSQYERLYLTWDGPKATEERYLILKVLPDLTWSEAVQPAIPAPSEVMLVESDLAPAFNTVIEDGTVAAGRRRGGRPAWLLSQDFHMMRADRGQSESEQQRLVLAKMARFHALHWGALPVINQVYPWLPRFSRWLEHHCAAISRRLDGPPAGEENDPYEAWLGRHDHNLDQILQMWREIPPTEPLRALLREPRPLVEALEATPQSIIHGDWQREDCFLTGRQLVVSEWDYIQAGPAAWDLICFLAETAASEEAATGTYLDELATVITELDGNDREQFRRSLALCRIAAILLLPYGGGRHRPDNRQALLESALEAAGQL